MKNHKRNWNASGHHNFAVEKQQTCSWLLCWFYLLWGVSNFDIYILQENLTLIAPVPVSTLRPRQNCRNFADDIFKKMHLRELKYSSFDTNFTEVCSQGIIWQYCGIGPDVLVPNRRPAIVKTYDGLDCRRIYASIGLNEYKKNPVKYECMEHLN